MCSLQWALRAPFLWGSSSEARGQRAFCPVLAVLCWVLFEVRRNPEAARCWVCLFFPETFRLGNASQATGAHVAHPQAVLFLPVVRACSGGHPTPADRPCSLCLGRVGLRHLSPDRPKHGPLGQSYRQEQRASHCRAAPRPSEER